MIETGSHLVFFLFSTVYAINKLKNQYFRLDKVQHDIDILWTCRDLNIIPKFLQSRSKYLSTNFANEKFKFEFRCLQNYIRMKFSRLDTIAKEIYGTRNDGLYHQLSVSCSESEFDLAMKKIDAFRQSIVLEHQNRLSNKILRLSNAFGRSPPTPAAFKFLNLSSRTFSSAETSLLSKGPKFICSSLPKPIDLIPQFEEVAKKINLSNREEVRSFIFQAFKKCSKSLYKSPLHDHQLLCALKKEPNIVFLSTDKSNKLAILDKTDYITKMDNAISEMDCDIIPNNPLNPLVTKVNKLIKLGVWPDDLKKMFHSTNLALIPSLFGVLKDHKPGNPLRPIVPKCVSPTYYIEKAMVSILKDLLPPSSRVLSSTQDFVNKLQSVSLPTTFIMVTLDIKSLYPSIDTQKAGNYISTLIQSSSNFSMQNKTTFIQALNLILSSNFFQFNNIFYRQKTGAPMGSPISGLLAEYILRPLEEQYLAQALLKPICWMRYVDDVFAIWPHTIPDFNSFCQNLNLADPLIQFTWEIEKENSIPFLDVLLKREGSTITRSIYRKPFNTMNTIPSLATAPQNYKLAAYRSFIRRAVVVCSQDTIHQEFDTIRNIAINNGFSIRTINSLILKVLRPSSNPPSSSNNIISRVPVTYIPIFHERVNNFLKQYNVQMVAKTNPKIKDFLKSKIDTLDPLDRAGVYQIPYSLSNGSKFYYIGLTSRKFKVRLSEHMRDIRNYNLTTALARTYFGDTTIQIHFNEAEVIVPFTTKSKSTLRESLEIRSRLNQVCNDQDSYNIPAIWISLINS